jgi:hypothetical protein
VIIKEAWEGFNGQILAIDGATRKRPTGMQAESFHFSEDFFAVHA